MAINYGDPKMRAAHLAERQAREAEAEARKQQLAEEPKELTVMQEVQQASAALNKSRRGRPHGALSKRVQEPREIVADTGLNPLRFLCLVARNRRHDIQTRVRAAQACLPFIFPKLAVSHTTQERNENLEFQKIQILVRDDGGAYASVVPDLA